MVATDQRMFGLAYLSMPYQTHLSRERQEFLLAFLWSGFGAFLSSPVRDVPVCVRAFGLLLLPGVLGVLLVEEVTSRIKDRLKLGFSARAVDRAEIVEQHVSSILIGADIRVVRGTGKRDVANG